METEKIIEWLKANDIKHITFLNEAGKQVGIFEAAENDSKPIAEIVAKFEEIFNTLPYGKYIIKGRSKFTVRKKVAQFEIEKRSNVIEPKIISNNFGENLTVEKLKSLLQQQNEIHQIELEHFAKMQKIKAKDSEDSDFLDKVATITKNIKDIFAEAKQMPAGGIAINKDTSNQTEIEKILENSLTKIVNAAGSDAVIFLQELASKSDMFIHEAIKIVLPILKKQ